MAGSGSYRIGLGRTLPKALCPSMIVVLAPSELQATRPFMLAFPGRQLDLRDFCSRQQRSNAEQADELYLVKFFR